MKITIEADPEEIAALVVELQERHDANVFVSERGEPCTSDATQKCCC